MSAQVSSGEAPSLPLEEKAGRASRLRLLSASCADCPLRPADASPEQMLEQVRAILDASTAATANSADSQRDDNTGEDSAKSAGEVAKLRGRSVSYAKVSWEFAPTAVFRRKANSEEASHAQLSRRDFFGFFSTKEDVAVPEELLATDAPTLPRAALLAALRNAQFPHPSATGEGCDGCRICVSACGTDALRWEDSEVGEGREGRLFVDPAKCVACADCVDSCPHQVLEFSGARAREEQLILTLRYAQCGKCGADLAPGEAEVCNRCKARGDILSDVWDQLA
ncbi:MAG: 4Fe-4S dicluster domain-containing protein [Actinomycetaceae bacterium]|nr:4Fe-4S dicluster domain-containing protein [Actinomycetaceae bacterium]